MSTQVNLNEPTRFRYDSEGRLITVISPLDAFTRFTYDGATRRVARIKMFTAPYEADITAFSYPAGTTGCPSATAVSKTVMDGPRSDVTDETTYCVDAHDRVVDTIDAMSLTDLCQYLLDGSV